MIRQNSILAIISLLFLLVSYATDPPNGRTGAPGESTCASCHSSSQSLNGTLEIQGFPSVITPGDTIHLTVVNRNTVGNAVKGGFQMTILGPLNTKVGKMINVSTNTRVQTSSNREYFEHHPAPAYPDSNVLRWNVDWVASNLPNSGLVTCYAAGIISNGNNSDSGDRTVATKVSGSVLLSANTEITSIQPTVYPNPGSSEIFVDFKNHEKPDGIIYFFSSTGSEVAKTTMDQGKIEVPSIPSGMYWMKLQSGTETYLEKWIKI